MKFWKLGTTWGRGAPDFFSMIQEKGIVISHASDADPKKGDIILVAKGFTIKALTILLEDAEPVTQRPFLENDFKNFKIAYDSDVLVANAEWIPLRNEDYFQYQNIDGICQVQKIETIVHTKKILNEYQQTMNLENQISLLKYKKQIILQGPPGTGKTHTAKIIAQQLALKSTITQEDIRKNIFVGQSIKSSYDYTTYVVDAFTEIGIKLKTINDTFYEPKFSEIIDTFQRKIWKNAQVKNGNDSYSAAIAKFIDENIKNDYSKNDQIKLIQFHPAYSYEDFVRGITIENNENQIEYLTKNKVLAEFALEAARNWKASNEPKEKVNIENWLEEILSDYKDDLIQKLEDDAKVMLTQKAYISRVTETSIRYFADAWNGEGGVPISDIKKMYLADVKNRKDIQQLSTLTKTAKSLSTYWFRVLEHFRKFISDNNLKPSESPQNTSVKNYVLIIDEINRANLPAVLGELIYALEYRGKSVDTMYEFEGDSKITLPENLFIIGTMNTADRSVGHIDYAIRRRFAFKDILPDVNVVHPLSKNLFKKVSELFVKDFDQIDWSNPHLKSSDYIASDFNAEDVWIGHSYFISKKPDNQEAEDELRLKLDYEIKPLLKEYVKDGILRADINLDGATDTLNYIQRLSL